MVVGEYAWPDLSIDQRAHEQAKRELGLVGRLELSDSDVRRLIVRGQEIKEGMRDGK